MIHVNRVQLIQTMTLTMRCKQLIRVIITADWWTMIRLQLLLTAASHQSPVSVSEEVNCPAHVRTPLTTWKKAYDILAKRAYFLLADNSAVSYGLSFWEITVAMQLAIGTTDYCSKESKVPGPISGSSHQWQVLTVVISYRAVRMGL